AHTRVTQVTAGLLSRKQKIPYVTTCHGFYRRRLGRRLFPCWGESAIAISDAVKRHLIRDFCLPEEKVCLVPNGVDLDRFRPVDPARKRFLRKQLGLPAEGQIIGSISRLVAVKGHDALLKCMASLRKEHPQATLVLVGEGELRPELEKESARLGLTDRVFFPGEVEDPLPYYQALDVYVHPSKWEEGFGLSAAEAMACALPVVASMNPRGGLGMFITHGENGYLFEKSDPELFRGALAELLQNPELAERIGANGRRVIAENFSAEQMTQGILELYEKVVRR
ncbi:MAG: glycosyltransferase family 4 protein, partial [Candidatus Omnitrophota bacterium]